MSLLEASPVYKPFKYPWAFAAWQQQQRIHWIPEEVSMAEDVRDWNHVLTKEEKNLLSQIFRFFTLSDMMVNDAYIRYYLPVFKNNEVLMMLCAFANQESLHQQAYAYLLDTVGMPETEYAAFRSYKEMTDKYDYMQSFTADNPYEIAKTMAAFAAFTEGLQLFASFAILLNFPRFNKMKGMGQIITWSVKDETLHLQSIIKLFHEFLNEHPKLWSKKLQDDIKEICKQIVKHEDAFIDLAFKMGGVRGLDSEEVKRYIRYIADRRLIELGIKGVFKVKKNPLPWVDEMLNAVEHTNFFENRATEYSKASTQGTWEDVFAEFDQRKTLLPQASNP